MGWGGRLGVRVWYGADVREGPANVLGGCLVLHSETFRLTRPGDDRPASVSGVVVWCRRVVSLVVHSRLDGARTRPSANVTVRRVASRRASLTAVTH